MASVGEAQIDVRPKYYEIYGERIANGNKAWSLAFAMAAVAFIAVLLAILSRLQPPTVIRIGPNGEPTVVGQTMKVETSSAAMGGTDEFLNEAFVTRFLSGYLNYSPSNVDEHFSAALNMMTRNLRDYTYKALKDNNTPGKIVNEQIQSEFHLRELDRVPGAGINYLAYGVKDVHHLVDGTDTVDHFVDEYHIKVLGDQRSKHNPDGLWIAEYSERSIDGERRARILAAADHQSSNE